MRTGRWASPALPIIGCAPSGSSHSPESLGPRHGTAPTVVSVPEPVAADSGLLARAWRTGPRPMAERVVRDLRKPT